MYTEIDHWGKWYAIHSTFSSKLKLHFCAKNDFNDCSVNIRYCAP